MIIPSGPDTPPDYGDKINSLLSEMDDEGEAIAAFPYLTTEGIEQYCTDNEGNDWREKCNSRWIIGISQGITSPDAIRSLTHRPRSEVRIYLPRENIDIDSIFRPPHLHAKFVGLYSLEDHQESHILCTSANATGAAVGSTPKNFELGSFISGEGGEVLTDSLWEWWDKMDMQAVPATEDVVDHYEKLRESLSDERSPEIEEESIIETDSPSQAKYMWTETGSMQGQQRYILEIKEELANFFDEKIDGGSEINILYNGKLYYGLRLTRHGNHFTPQWRVFLPTDFSRHDSDFYRYKCARFEKLRYDDSGRVYELEICETGGPTHNRWRDQASQNGVHDQTGGGREFGYY